MKADIMKPDMQMQLNMMKKTGKLKSKAIAKPKGYGPKGTK